MLTGFFSFRNARIRFKKNEKSNKKKNTSWINDERPHIENIHNEHSRIVGVLECATISSNGDESICQKIRA